MRQLRFFVSLALLCGLLFGCGKPETPPVTEPPEVSQPEIRETIPVAGENTIYFANGQEYYRLYSRNPDTGEMRLVLDESCYDVRQVENAVYFLQNETLWACDIPTSGKQCIQEQVADYAVEGEYLLYTRVLEDYSLELNCRSLKTGEMKRLCHADYIWFAAGDGYVFYEAWYGAENTTVIRSVDLQTGEEWLICQDEICGSTVCAAENGLLYAKSTAQGVLWFFSSADGTVQKEITAFAPGNCTYSPLYATEREILYVYRVYGIDSCSQIRRLTADGEDILVAEAEHDRDYSCYPVKEGIWLVEQSAYVPWGPVNEYGYQEHYSHQIQYELLRKDGTMTPMDAGGELAGMFSEGDFPVIDSSTARKPVTAELCNIFVKNHGYTGTEPLCSTTHGAWLNIADGTVDLALLAAPTPQEQEYLRQKGVQIEMKLYGGDGLVFIGNKENPVDDLTHEQLLDIYRGKITNWKELGGPDHPITVYYRDDQSGSQRLFEKLVWKDAEIPDFYALGFDIEDEMSSIVYMVQEDPYAIGYTIMTYLDDVYGEDSLRVFAINGVIPSPETIADGSYAYHTQGYLVIRADEPADSPARRLYDWFGCPVSDELLRQCGVTPLHG